MKFKKRKLGGVEYVVLGSTIEREGFKVIGKSYSTNKGKVIIKEGKVFHPDGAITSEY